MLDATTVNDLEGSLRGQLLRPGDSGFHAASQVYNAMIQREPAVIARCADVADVIAAVRFARDNDLIVAVRGGGHNAGGLGVCDGGLVIDLSRMRGVRVDPDERTARVEGGCTWGDVDHATHAFGLATVSGIISTTGVGGLTLGGGHGYLTRKYGLTIDNLLAADVVLADGRLVRASADENEDLFWALRGGGGNFGVVTSFLFRLHCVDTVHAGPTLWQLEDAAEAMRFYRDLMREAPEDLYGFFAFLSVPPGPPFPAHLHGKTVAGAVWCYLGPDEGADEMLEPVRSFEPTAFQHIGKMPYPQLQSTFDPLYPSGLQWYWKADFVRDLPDEAIVENVRHGAQLPTPLSSMHLYPIDGAPQRVGPNETAFHHRDANFSQVIVGVSPDPADNERMTQWTRDYWDAVHPYSAGGAYVNFMMDEGEDRIVATYRDNYPRLVEIKNKYDPTNLFRMNQNIKPTRAR